MKTLLNSYVLRETNRSPLLFQLNNNVEDIILLIIIKCNMGIACKHFLIKVLHILVLFSALFQLKIKIIVQFYTSNTL